jgi:hypothetical protein
MVDAAAASADLMGASEPMAAVDGEVRPRRCRTAIGVGHPFGRVGDREDLGERTTSMIP